MCECVHGCILGTHGWCIIDVIIDWSHSFQSCKLWNVECHFMKKDLPDGLPQQFQNITYEEGERTEEKAETPRAERLRSQCSRSFPASKRKLLCTRRVAKKPSSLSLSLSIFRPFESFRTYVLIAFLTIHMWIFKLRRRNYGNVGFNPPIGTKCETTFRIVTITRLLESWWLPMVFSNLIAVYLEVNINRFCV